MVLPGLILASQSKARQAMLVAAGLSFDVQPAAVDEESLIAAIGQKESVSEIAIMLAQKKALQVSRGKENYFVIGSDQILFFEGEILGKVDSEEKAKARLKELRGKTHRLISAVCVTKGDDVLWQASDDATLNMRDFDDDFLGRYMCKAGDALTRSVGCYELESYGSWLFEKVEGDNFTIMGMPLLPLLGFLKEQGFGP